MIFAAVLVLTAGFSMGIGYLWGSRDAADSILSKWPE